MRAESLSELFFDSDCEIGTWSVPPYFSDLNLDQIMSGMAGGWAFYNLEAYFFRPLEYIAQIQSRQMVFEDLADAQVLAAAFTPTSVPVTANIPIAINESVALHQRALENSRSVSRWRYAAHHGRTDQGPHVLAGPVSHHVLATGARHVWRWRGKR